MTDHEADEERPHSDGDGERDIHRTWNCVNKGASNSGSADQGKDGLTPE
jgi:hypothetical protein